MIARRSRVYTHRTSADLVAVDREQTLCCSRHFAAQGRIIDADDSNSIDRAPVCERRRAQWGDGAGVAPGESASAPRGESRHHESADPARCDEN